MPIPDLTNARKAMPSGTQEVAASGESVADDKTKYTCALACSLLRKQGVKIGKTRN